MNWSFDLTLLTELMSEVSAELSKSKRLPTEPCEAKRRGESAALSHWDGRLYPSSKICAEEYHSNPEGEGFRDTCKVSFTG